MGRMDALELIEHTICSMELDDKVQTIALALYLLTQNESLRSRFNLGNEDFLADYGIYEEENENYFQYEEPVAPKRKTTNKFVDDGSLAAEDRDVDRKIQRPQYKRNQENMSGKYYRDERCVKCNRKNYIDTRDLKKAVYASGFVCDGCITKRG